MMWCQWWCCWLDGALRMLMARWADIQMSTNTGTLCIHIHIYIPLDPHLYTSTISPSYPFSHIIDRPWFPFKFFLGFLFVPVSSSSFPYSFQASLFTQDKNVSVNKTNTDTFVSRQTTASTQAFTRQTTASTQGFDSPRRKISFPVVTAVPAGSSGGDADYFADRSE